MDQPKVDEVRSWMAKARADLDAARFLPTAPVPHFDVAIYHCQQAAEKALKAVLLHRKIEFPFIHDIEELLEIMTQSGLLVPPDVADAGALTPYAVEARYPGYEEEIASSQVDEAIRLAENAVTWAARMLSRHKKSS